MFHKNNFRTSCSDQYRICIYVMWYTCKEKTNLISKQTSGLKVSKIHTFWFNLEHQNYQFGELRNFDTEKFRNWEISIHKQLLFHLDGSVLDWEKKSKIREHSCFCWRKKSKTTILLESTKLFMNSCRLYTVILVWTHLLLESGIKRRKSWKSTGFGRIATSRWHIENFKILHFWNFLLCKTIFLRLCPISLAHLLQNSHGSWDGHNWKKWDVSCFSSILWRRRDHWNHWKTSKKIVFVKFYSICQLLYFHFLFVWKGS